METAGDPCKSGFRFQTADQIFAEPAKHALCGDVCLGMQKTADELNVIFGQTGEGKTQLAVDSGPRADDRAVHQYGQADQPLGCYRMVAVPEVPWGVTLRPTGEVVTDESQALTERDQNKRGEGLPPCLAPQTTAPTSVHFAPTSALTSG